MQQAAAYGADAESVCLNMEEKHLRSVMESVVQAFRTHKRFIEKQITQSVNKLTLMKKQSCKPEEIQAGVQGHIENLKTLKSKYTQLLAEENDFWENLKKRAKHLADLETAEGGTALQNYFDLKFDRTILDYMLRQGYFTSAKLFAQQKSICEFSDLPLFQEIRRIKASLESENDCGPALAWCSTNRTKLGRTMS